MKARCLAAALALICTGTAAIAADTISATHVFPASLVYSRSFLEFVKKANDAGKGVFAIQVRGGPEAIGPTLGRIVRDADDAGFDSIWVMDHFFQIRSVGSVEEPMLEGWTTLGFMAANSSRARLGLMVGGVHYRYPGLWIKAATTLDVMSNGRLDLGIGHI